MCWTEGVRPAQAAAFLLLASACADTPGTEVAVAVVPAITVVGDTTISVTPAPGVAGPTTLKVLWELDEDPLHLGALQDGALGSDGTIWFSISGGLDDVGLYRVDQREGLVVMARRGTDPDARSGEITVHALSNGEVLSIERASGRAIRFDANGRILDTMQKPVFAGASTIWPDRHGGWFVRALGDTAWWRFGPDGELTDTLPIPAAWLAAAPQANGIAQDGSLLRAGVGASRIQRRAGSGQVVEYAWSGDPLIGAVWLAHDPANITWVGDTPSPDIPRLRAFDRDGAMRFVVTLPPLTRLLDQSGPYLLARRTSTDGPTGLVLWEIVPATDTAGS